MVQFEVQSGRSKKKTPKMKLKAGVQGLGRDERRMRKGQRRREKVKEPQLFIPLARNLGYQDHCLSRKSTNKKL